MWVFLMCPWLLTKEGFSRASKFGFEAVEDVNIIYASEGQHPDYLQNYAQGYIQSNKQISK